MDTYMAKAHDLRASSICETKEINNYLNYNYQLNVREEEAA